MGFNVRAVPVGVEYSVQYVILYVTLHDTDI